MAYDDDWFDEDDNSILCPRCDGAGIVSCYCGGDLCVCDNYGEKDCPLCWGERYVDPESVRVKAYMENEREMAESMRRWWDKQDVEDFTAQVLTNFVTTDGNLCI